MICPVFPLFPISEVYPKDQARAQNAVCKKDRQDSRQNDAEHTPDSAQQDVQDHIRGSFSFSAHPASPCKTLPYSEYWPICASDFPKNPASPVKRYPSEKHPEAAHNSGMFNLKSPHISDNLAHIPDNLGTYQLIAHISSENDLHIRPEMKNIQKRSPPCHYSTHISLCQ